MKTKLIFLYIIACFSAALLGSETPPWQVAREWTTPDGKFKTEARFVGEIDGAYVLKKVDDGKLVEIPKIRLSEKDRQFVIETVKLSPLEKDEPQADDFPEGEFFVEGVLPSYTIISDTGLRNIKRSVDVRLKARVTKERLMELAKEIRKKSPKQYERTFICYYLPGMEPGAGAWATSHFEKDKMDVRFTGIEPSENKPRENKLKNELSNNTNKERAKKIIADCEALIKELKRFKDKPDFHTYGFGRGGPYNAWLKKVENLRDASPGMNEVGLLVASLPGYVLELGMEYMKSKGKETEFTKKFQTEILNETKYSIE